MQYTVKTKFLQTAAEIKQESFSSSANLKL